MGLIIRIPYGVHWNNKDVFGQKNIDVRADAAVQFREARAWGIVIVERQRVRIGIAVEGAESAGQTQHFDVSLLGMSPLIQLMAEGGNGRVDGVKEPESSNIASGEAHGGTARRFPGQRQIAALLFQLLDEVFNQQGKWFRAGDLERGRNEGR